MFKSIIQAKKSFYDRNPSGRILNRFSSDIGIMDHSIVQSGLVVFNFGVRQIVGLTIISYISYYLVIPCLLIIVAFRWIGLYFNKGIIRIK